MRGNVMLVAVVVCTGCFRYVPIETQPLPQGAEVVATLAVPGEARLHNVTLHDVTVARGRVLFADGDSVVVESLRLETVSGTDYRGEGALVTLQRRQLAHLTRRRVSGVKTGLMLGAGAGVIVLLVTSVGALFGGGDSAVEPPPLP
jgi:hypothetical protein